MLAVSRLVVIGGAVLARQISSLRRDFPSPDHIYWHGHAPPTDWIRDALLKWDAFWFLHVARDGYVWTGVPTHAAGAARETNLTVFPALPLALRAFGALGLPVDVAGLVFSHVVLLLVLWGMLTLFRRHSDEASARRAVLYFALFPTSIVYSSIYAEGPLLLGWVACLLWFERERGVASGLAAMVASASRVTGLAILPAVAWRLAQRAFVDRQVDRTAIAILLLAPLGVLVFLAFTWSVSGSPTAYFESQAGWHKALAPPWVAINRALSLAIENPSWYRLWMQLGAVTVALAWTVVAIRRVPATWRVLWVTGLLHALCATSLLGFPRYAGALFPMFLPLGAWAATRGRHWLVSLLLAAAAALAAAAWTNWYVSF